MTFTYSGDPGASDIDQVRFLIGDTNSADPYLTDEEIEWMVGTNGSNPLRAAINAVETILAKLTRSAVSKSVGDLSLSYSTSDQFKSLASVLRRRLLSASPATIYVGGVTRSDMLIDQLDPDLVRPYIKLGGTSYPGTGDNSSADPRIESP